MEKRKGKREPVKQKFNKNKTEIFKKKKKFKGKNDQMKFEITKQK